MTDDKPIASEGELALIEHQIDRVQIHLINQTNGMNEAIQPLLDRVEEIKSEWAGAIADGKQQLWKLRAQVHDYYLRDAYPVETEEAKGSWSADVFSMRDLIAAAAQNPEEYAQYLKPNDVALNKRARTDKAAFHVPGVAAVRKEKESKA